MTHGGTETVQHSKQQPVLQVLATSQGVTEFKGITQIPQPWEAGEEFRSPKALPWCVAGPSLRGGLGSAQGIQVPPQLSPGLSQLGQAETHHSCLQTQPMGRSTEQSSLSPGHAPN